MNFLELATKRSSIRSFKTDEVEKEKLLYLLEAARMAPSAANFQPWQFVVVTEPELLKSIRAVYNRDWFFTAPAIIIALADHSKGWRRAHDGKDYTEIDVAIAIDHLTLAAAELGLGTCWVCNFDCDRCSDLFHIPENMEPIALIPVGYPAKSVKTVKQREPLDQIVHWNSF